MCVSACYHSEAIVRKQEYFLDYGTNDRNTYKHRIREKDNRCKQWHQLFLEYPRNWQIIIKAYLDNWQSLKGIIKICVLKYDKDRTPLSVWIYRSCMKHHFWTKSISPYYFTVRKRTSAPFCRANSCSTVRLSVLCDLLPSARNTAYLTIARL